MCLTSADIGVPVYSHGELAIAHAHPMCPVHGDGCDGFELDRTDAAGREYCARCGCLRAEHHAEARVPGVRKQAIAIEASGGYTDSLAHLLDLWEGFDRADKVVKILGTHQEG